MSTKSSIKCRDHTAAQPGFHLYEDVMDSFGAQEGDTEPPVYLQLDGLQVQLETHQEGGAIVTVAIPREMARLLGLLPSK
jgi:hypothetical protein